MERSTDLQLFLAQLRGARDAEPSQRALLLLQRRIRHRARRSLAPHNPLRQILDSEDLTQETLGHLVRVVDRFRGTTWPEFLAFAHRILDQRLTDQARSNVRDRSGNPGPPPGSFDIRSDGDGALAFATGREDRHRLHEAVAALPHDLREVVERRLQEQDYETIGAALGIRPETARKRFSRGLEWLRERLGGD